MNVQNELKTTHKKGAVVQSTGYYPFGLQTADSWTREDALGNSFLYNAGSEFNESTGNYQTFFREYDPALGRMTAIDPLAAKYSSWSPYNYAFNDPVALNDPSGAEPDFECTVCNPDNSTFMERLDMGGLGAALNMPEDAYLTNIHTFANWTLGNAQQSSLANDIHNGSASAAYQYGQLFGTSYNSFDEFFKDNSTFKITSTEGFSSDGSSGAYGEWVFDFDNSSRGTLGDFQDQDLNSGLNSFIQSLSNLADHDAEEAFYNEYYKKIPGYTRDPVTHEIYGERRYLGFTDLSEYNLPTNLSGWIKDREGDGIELYLNLVGATDATITNKWQDNLLGSYQGDKRFISGPAILLRDGQVDILVATFHSVASKKAFFNRYYGQRYKRRFENIKKAWKHYIGN